jgi:RHS repeat-associated protein
MIAKARDVLCLYHYDPLDRLIGTTPINDAGLQRFYCKDRVVTEVQGALQRTIFQQNDQLLAQHYQQGLVVEPSLLATDQAGSVLQIVKANHSNPVAYSPYGHRPAESSLLSLLGFNGQRPDPVIGHYLLGSGYRAFAPVLMRFNSPDTLSPFGKGGLNAYAYCTGDPVNLSDPSGHFILSSIKSFFGIKPKSTIYYHKGFHGTKLENKKSLLQHGPDPSRIGTGEGSNMLGEGFYSTRSYGEAKIYAREYFSAPSGFFEMDYASATPMPSEGVLSVYVRKMNKVKYDRNHYSHSNHTVLRKKIFKDIILRPTTHDGKRVPLEPILKIRKT